MRRRFAAVCLLGAAGCDGEDALGGGGAFAVADYFAGAEAWTWRDGDNAADTAEDATVDDASLLRAELGEGGVVTVRRGARFADGEPVGTLSWDLLATDLSLAAWTWNGEGSEEATIMARNGGLPGEPVANLSGSCVADTVDDLETRYGLFDHALKSTCTGTAAPEGDWWFAKGFGLVKADTDTFVLDLVAPR